MYSTKQIMIFLIILSVVYFSSNIYIYIRTMQSLSLQDNYKWIARISLITIMMIAPLSLILSTFMQNTFVNILIVIRSIWLGVMLYAFLLIVLFDLYRLIDYFIHITPDIIKNNYVIFKRIVLIISTITIITILSIGYYNAKHFTINKLELDIEKIDKNTINLVIISDLHLGVNITKEHLERIVNSTNKLKPDLVLFTGDVVDEKFIDIDNMSDILKKLNPKFGSYGIIGNHEIIVGIDPSSDFIEKSNIKLLRNTSTIIDNRINLVGIDDPSINPNYKITKEMIKKTLDTIDHSLPIIYMSHQPLSIDYFREENVDLLLCGHTHNGQLFPLNLVVKVIFKIASGYARFGKMHVYVSNGVGTWGPPFRIAAPPEIVQIMIK